MRYTIILTIDTDMLTEDEKAEATVQPGTSIDIGDGTYGIVGQVVDVEILQRIRA